MQLIKHLESGGYDVQLIQRDGLQIVEAHRTPDATITAQTAEPFLLALMRCQDEAIQFIQSRSVVDRVKRQQQLRERIESNTLSPTDEAIAICEFNIALGREMTSDGLRWVDVLKEYQKCRE